MLANMFSDININMNNMPSARTIVSTAASVAASAMVLRSIARDLIPYEFQQFVYLNIHTFFKSFSSDIVLIVEEFDGLAANQIYKAADIYLGSKMASSATRLMVNLPEKETKISTSMARNQDVVDVFNGARFRWRQVTRQVESKRSSYPGGGQSQQMETRYFEIIFHKKHRQLVFDSYFSFILEESKRIQDEKKTLKIHTLSNDQMRRFSGDYAWSSVRLDHPATFDTLAMDSDVKKMVIDDLERFVKRREYYRKVGKAWKRGYLLYGPPGTGKSSLIAAMANYLNFDIYDLELTDIHANSDLRRLLINTANRSILVVEDIDCSLELEDRKADERALKLLRASQISQAQTVNIVRQQKTNQVTLSGFLNFIDGLWSSCGDERIIIFTSNHKERLDPALLRPGRMDLHIHMSYCTPCAFRTLASNYLGITEHSLFPEIDNLLETTKVTPAEVGERLLRNEEVDLALQLLIEFFEEKKREDEEKEAKRQEEELNAITAEEEKESDNSTNKTSREDVF